MDKKINAATIAQMRGLMQPTEADRHQALYKALGALGAGLLQHSGPSRLPGGLARGIGAGGQAFSQTYSGAMDAARKRNLGGLQTAAALGSLQDAETARATAKAEAEAITKARLDPKYKDISGLPTKAFIAAIAERNKYHAPKTVKTADGVYVLNPDGTKGQRLGAPALRPLAPKTVKTADGVYVLNPDGTKGAKIGEPAFAPQRPIHPLGLITTAGGVFLRNPDGSKGEKVGENPAMSFAKETPSAPHLQRHPGTGVQTAIPLTPKAEGERAAKVATAKRRAEVRFQLPKIRSTAKEARKLLIDLRNHPAKAAMIGLPGSLSGALFKLPGGGPIGGSPEAGFLALYKQITGQLFMKAFETLKGGGQITEIEGQKATEAQSRLASTAQSEEAFDEAIDELVEYLDRGVAVAEEQAGLNDGEDDPGDLVPVK